MTQPGIHWPHCIDRSCPGCMPNLPENSPPQPPCAPALGIHHADCDCPDRPAEGRP